MGALTLAAGARLFLDANAVIYIVERVAPYWPVLQPIAAAAAAGHVRLQSSELLIAEALPGPIRSGNVKLLALYERVLSSELGMVPIGSTTLRRAAELRAAHHLKTPDSIYAATAIGAGCDHFITNDLAFRRVPGLDVIIVSELVPGP